jgi:hypothetical protein
MGFKIAVVSLFDIFPESLTNALFVLTQHFHWGFQVMAPALIMLRALLVRNGNGRQQYTEWSSGVKSILQFDPRTMASESDLEAETVQAGSRQTDINLGSNSNPNLGFASSPSQWQQEKGMATESLSWAWYSDQYALTWLETREPA